eukprot:Skav221384  [mRNA]  locus=scaffold4031:10725:18837:+ [translate_table: standard]
MAAFHVVFSKPDLAADSEVKFISFSGLAVMILMGFLGYALHGLLRQRPNTRLFVLGLTGLPMIIGPMLGGNIIALPSKGGLASVDSMQSPLLLSTSLRDFWGRRWNLVVHRLMKRTFFAPVVGRSRWLAGLLAFMMSGLFHEYMRLGTESTSQHPK